MTHQVSLVLCTECLRLMETEELKLYRRSHTWSFWCIHEIDRAGEKYTRTMGSTMPAMAVSKASAS